MHDNIVIALFGQKELPVHGEILLAGVARDQRIEVGLGARGLGPEDAAEPLRLLLARSEGARDLDGHVGVGQIDREIAHLGDDEPLDPAVAEIAVEVLSLRGGVTPVMTGSRKASASA